MRVMNIIIFIKIKIDITKIRGAGFCFEFQWKSGQAFGEKFPTCRC